MWSLGQDVRHQQRSRNLDKPHRTIFDDLVGEALPDVDVLGSFASADDVVSLFVARGIVLVYRGGGFFCLNPRRSRRARRYRTSQPAADAEQYSAAAVESAVVFCHGAPHDLRLPHDRRLVVQHDHARRQSAG